MNAKGPEQTSTIVKALQHKQHAVQWSAEPGQLAAQIKTARQKKNLTLKALSEQSGIATSALSKIENNQVSPSVQTLQHLIQALELDLPQLFAPSHGKANLSRRVLTRRTEGVSHTTSAYEHRLLANDLSQKKLLPFTSTIRARTLDSFNDWVRHKGEEFLMVLRGTVDLHCEFYEPARLEAGDSSYLDSTMGHALVSVSEEDAEVLWVASLS